MKKKIKIQNTIYWSIVVTLIFTALFIFICIFNQKQFHSFQESSQQYVLCKDSVEQLEEGCDYLVEQARLYAMTGNEYYMDLYFREAHMTKRREHALKQLEEYFDGTQTFTSLKSALKSSGDLMSIDYYSMRLIADANRISEDSLQQEVAAVKLTDEDALLSSEEKLKKSQFYSLRQYLSGFTCSDESESGKLHTEPFGLYSEETESCTDYFFRQFP
ncbi:MAG: hypothetical protein ACLUVD_02695 [Mediterraneibacter faecis]